MTTKKDFTAIAKVLKDAIPINDGRVKVSALDRYERFAVVSEVANGLADYFGETNSNFDRDRFLKAAGVATE